MFIADQEMDLTMKMMHVVLATLVAAVPSAALADRRGQSTEASLAVEEKPFGRAGDPKKASRTIRVEMNDAMRFKPGRIEVRQGETVRFSVKNSGKILHEMVLGTLAELKEHAELMRTHPGMEHDEPHMVHVRAGKSGSMVWQFTSPGEFYYACLIPGHLEAGMLGMVRVTAKGESR